MTRRAAASPNGGTGLHQYAGCSRLDVVQERREPRAAAARGIVDRGRRRPSRSGTIDPLWSAGIGGRDDGSRLSDRIPRRPRQQYIALLTPVLPNADLLIPMLPPEPHLEVVSRLPKRATRKPPLLFVHGGYCDAWCWTPYFLPWFAARGWPAYALSLRGHGASGGIVVAVRRGSRRLRRRRRACRGTTVGAADAHRPFDGRRGHRAHAGHASGARRGVAGARAAGGIAVRWPRDWPRRTPTTCRNLPSSTRRSCRTACLPHCGRSISAPACPQPSSRKPSGT